MESGSRRVFRYSSTHEKEIPDGFIRCRMEIHRAPPASLQRARAAQDPQPSRDPQRRLLPAKERLPVAPTAPRLPQVAHRLLVFQEMATKRCLGEDQPGHPRAPQGPPEKGPSTQRGGGLTIGEEYRGGRGRARGYDGGKKVKGRKRHILVDTEGFVLQAKRSTAPRWWTTKGSRRYCGKRTSDSPASLTCGWTLASAEKARARTGSRRPWAGAWTWWSVRKSPPPKRC